MRTKSLVILLPVLLMLVAAITSVSSQIAAGQAVYQQYQPYQPDYGHSVGDVSVSPSSGACRGQQVHVSGTGAAANSNIQVMMVTNGSHPGCVGCWGANLGTAISDASGAWSLITTVPPEIMPDSSMAHVTESGPWAINATWLPNYAGYTDKQDALMVLDCTVSDAQELPSTGSPTLGFFLAGSLLLVMGICLRTRLRRS